MATTLTGPATPSNELAYASFDIVKFEKTDDGDIYVLGKASDDSVDSDEQIVDSKWMQKAVQDWLSTGANVRVQHNSQRDPAGVGVEAYTEKDGSTWVKSLVVEPVAKTLVEKGVLRAYSVGIARPKIMRDSVARGGRIVDGELCEISLVDRPANKNCGIQLVKSASDGTAEYVDELFGTPEIELAIKGASVATEADVEALVTKVQKSISHVLNKAAAPETVTVDLPKDVSVSFSPADLQKLLAHRQTAQERVEAGEIAEKRKMDPDVGGGVDRDKIPGADFAGRGRSFPIVTPGDVSDAASSIGRAGSDNYSSDELKHRIISIARRKGPSFVAELPDSWKEEMGVGKSEDVTEEDDVTKGHPFVNSKKPDDEDDNEGSADEPDSDDEESDADEGVEKGKKGKKKPFPGAKEAFGKEDADGKDSDGDGHDMDEKPKNDEAKPDATKGSKDCAGCGRGYDADTSMKRCENCGKKLPKADKTVEGDAEKKLKSTCQKCGAMSNAEHHFCPECGHSKATALPVAKNHDFMCLGCDNKLDKGEKFCPGCGKENPGYLAMADRKIKAVEAAVVEKKKKGKKPVPGKGVVGPAASAIDPVPAHREPDGMAVEAFEHDAGLPTDPDRNAMKTAQRFKDLGVPADMGALHDHLCAAFHPQDVAKCFHEDAIASLDVLTWQEKSFDVAASGSMDEARAMARLWQHATALKGADPEVVAELRDEAYKEFKDANKGPGTFPTPTELSPTRFNRPYLMDGHANPGTGHSGPNTHAVPTHHIEGSDFDRDHIDAGHAEDSPSNKNMGVIEPAPLPPGMGRTYYRNAERESAKAAMRAMHDHIAQTFPDLCSMSGPGVGGEPPVGAREVPLPVGKSEKEDIVETPETAENVDELTTKAQKLIAKARAAAEAAGLEDVFFTEKADAVEPVAPADIAEILKGIVTEATAPLLEQISEQQKLLKKQQKRLDEMAELPDPREAAFKGLAMKNNSTNTVNKSAGGVPVAATTVAENAERTQMALMQALQSEARNNPDPAQREAAWSRLYQMTGINP